MTDLTVEILDQKLSAMEQRFDKEFVKLETQNKELRSEINSIKAWVIATVLVGVLVVTALMNTYIHIAGS